MAKQEGGWWRRNVRRVTHAEEQTDAQRARAPWVLLAFLLVIILVGFGVWALRVFVFEPSQSQASPSPTSTSPLETTAGGELPPVDETGSPSCVLDSTSSDLSVTPPAASRWVVESEIVIPEVPGAGPCTQFDGYRAGFAQTQAGAVVAAYYYGATLVTNDPAAHTAEQARYALVDGPLKDSILQRISDVEAGVEVRAPEGQKAGQEFAGYRVVSFAGDSAIVELLIRQIETGRTIGAVVTLAWVNGDWRIDPATPTDWASPVMEPRLSDYVQWNQRG